MRSWSIKEIKEGTVRVDIIGTECLVTAYAEAILTSWPDGHQANLPTSRQARIEFTPGAVVPVSRVVKDVISAALAAARAAAEGFITAHTDSPEAGTVVTLPPSWQATTMDAPVRWTKVSDDDGQDYLIPADDFEAFDAWLAGGAQDGGDPPGSAFRIEGGELTFESPVYAGEAVPHAWPASSTRRPRSPSTPSMGTTADPATATPRCPTRS